MHQSIAYRTVKLH